MTALGRWTEQQNHFPPHSLSVPSVAPYESCPLQPAWEGKEGRRACGGCYGHRRERPPWPGQKGAPLKSSQIPRLESSRVTPTFQKAGECGVSFRRKRENSKLCFGPLCINLFLTSVWASRRQGEELFHFYNLSWCLIVCLNKYSLYSRSNSPFRTPTSQ